MHTLLVYLQTALQDQCPVVAGLLLQLDLLAEPRKMSIYWEEAIDTLISCLKNSDFPAAQIAAAETILSLQGRFTYSGKPLTRAFLLKRVGLVKSYKTLMRVEQLNNASGELEETLEEEKAAEEWERKMAFVLVSHEFGLLFEALADGLRSKYAEVWSIGNEVIHCTQVHDMKDQVHNLVVANSISCFIPQGAGVKVQSWNGNSKLLNPTKHVKCLTLVNDKLYCGCNDNSIQESGEPRER